MLTKNTDKLRRVVAEHIDQDTVVQGIYWDEETFHGCFIGCLAHGNKPELNEEQYGLPVMLQRIAENIFEALSADEAKEFFAALPDAVGCDGKDLTRVSWQFLASELRALPQQKADIQASIDSVIAGMNRLAAGQEWREAAAAAAAATDAARYADVARAAAAAWAAVDTAWAAKAAEWVVEAAEWAVEAAKWVVEVAKWAAAANFVRRRQRDLLLRLIAEAPVVERLQELEGQGND